jgi:dipeptidyl aminopeptidase/acylaminoacyl peptidase
MWERTEEYITNSPIVHAHRIQTPLLLVAGDFDTSVPPEQLLQMFGAMNRLGKEAKLLMYRGEGHVLNNPSNIKDYWQQMLLWFDKYLKK